VGAFVSHRLWQLSGLSPLLRARIDVWFFLKELEDGGPSNPAPRRGIQSQPMVTPWDTPIKKYASQGHPEWSRSIASGASVRGRPGGAQCRYRRIPKVFPGAASGMPLRGEKSSRHGSDLVSTPEAGMDAEKKNTDALCR
jgi:hypothetical protein